jgi:SAM-dependent methyltransferase
MPITNYHEYFYSLKKPINIDTFFIKSSIFNSLKIFLPDLTGYLLDVGCGQMPYKSLVTSPPSRVTRYIGLDLKGNSIHKNNPDITWKDGKIPLSDNAVDCAICTEVLEHCIDPDKVLMEIYRVLKPGGLLFFTVPFLWPLHEVPYDNYRYTPFSLEFHLKKSGFTQIELRSLGGWDASLAQMLGLWIRRRPMRKWLRICFSYLFWPFVLLLYKVDNSDRVSFKENSMFTGIAGSARKLIN